MWATIAVVVAAGIAATGLLRDRSGAQPDQARGPSSTAIATSRSSQVVLVRRRGGVPAGWARRLRRAAGVTAVARTHRTQALLRSSERKEGTTVDAAPTGYAFPLDVLVVRPRAYARVLPSAAGALRLLRPRTALLSESSARLRRLRPGDRLTLVGGRTLRVVGVVDDELVRAAEVVLGPSDAGRPPSRSGQLLVASRRPARVARVLPGDDVTRVRAVWPATGASTAPIARPMEVKARFGEFAVRLPYADDWIGIEPRWLRRNIVTRSVPILGAVTCHRRFIRPLRRALTQLDRRGLSSLVDPGDYAGCYAPRRIPSSGSLSLHAWGLAIDLNAGANPPLGESRQDPRLVRAMERAGLTWGGRWPTAPDPMHFELQPPS